MKKIRVFVGMEDKSFAQRLRRLSAEVEVLDEAGSPEETASLEETGSIPERVDLYFLDFLPPTTLTDLPSKGVIVTSRYSQKKELLAARMGAKGFIRKDISEAALLKAVRAVSAGEVWMTRATVARVFDEYARMARKSGDGH